MKLWAGRFQKQTDELVNDFNASISFDQRLYEQDITGSMAHAQMLCDCGILTAQDNEKIQQGLTELLAEIEAGKVTFTADNEDIHMNVETLLTAKIGDAGKRLHTAIRYGVSQAILDAVAKATGRLMCEVVADEYGCTVSQTPIPIFTQSGDDRYDNADKMIIKRAQVLPHALINNVQTKLGEHGEKLLEYVKWLRGRILTMRADENYQPVLHIDVYGTIGAAFGNNNYAAMADYLAELEQAAKPFHLRIEGPMDCDCDRETQIVALAGLTAELDRRGIQVELVADEWCNTLEDIREFADRRAGHMVQIKTPDLGGINNTIEAVLYCKAHGIGAYQGGTCNETDRSAQVCVHCAMATQPVQILAKPGMGVDEGYMIVSNEMNRILALRQAKLR